LATISLYTPYWSTRGGGERYLLRLANALSKSFKAKVALLMHPSDPPLQDIERYFNLDLSAITVMPVRSESNVAEVTRGMDLFVLLSNVKLVKSLARKKVLLLQIPFARPSARNFSSDLLSGRLMHTLKHIRRRSLFAFAQSSADLVLCNSRFTADILSKNFGIRAEILYPPVEDFQQEGAKRRNVILSVGRFFAGFYNEKRYDFLTSVFRRLHQGPLSDWEYHLAGSFVDSSASRRLVEKLKRENKGFPVHFHINESYDSLRRLYNEATVFWHAAGYGIDVDRNPERAEHFGMSTVEAMSTGCIPVVANKGGQKEIVQHGVCGFLWDRAEQLADHTVAIASGTLPVGQLQQQAREQSQKFSVAVFEQRVREFFTPLLTNV
jgi:glycosyltransferase involved in cell wall biosynthesis